MLQIRLSKPSSLEAGGSKPAVSSENVRVSCPDYLVLADLPVAKALGSTCSNASVVKFVGRRSSRQLGARVHFCVRCNLPIAIYGRLSPCEHAFCLTCARSDFSCYLCDERIQNIQTIKMLEGIFICAAPHCFKSFLKRMEFELHINETHWDLLQPIVEKNEAQEKDVPKARPDSSDPQLKKPSNSQPRVLSPSPSVSSFQASEQHHHMSESPSLQFHPMGVLVSSATSPEERDDKPQHNQSKGSSGTQQQDMKQLSRPQIHHKQSNYHWQHFQQQGYEGNSGDSSQDIYQENQQGFEKPYHQLHQKKHPRYTHGERHAISHEQHLDLHSDNQHHQQQEKPYYEYIHQKDAEHQNMHGKQQQNQFLTKPASQLVMPLQYPYHIPPGGAQQNYNPQYHPTGLVTFLDGLPVQNGIQTFQDNNQRIPMQASAIQEFQENHFAPWHVGLSHEATAAPQVPQEGCMAPDLLGQFPHFPIDYGPGQVSMPLPPPLHGTGTGPDQPVQYEDSNQVLLVPPPKRGKYLNTHAQRKATKEVHNLKG